MLFTKLFILIIIAPNNFSTIALELPLAI